MLTCRLSSRSLLAALFLPESRPRVSAVAIPSSESSRPLGPSYTLTNSQGSGDQIPHSQDLSQGQR